MCFPAIASIGAAIVWFMSVAFQQIGNEDLGIVARYRRERWPELGCITHRVHGFIRYTVQPVSNN